MKKLNTNEVKAFEDFCVNLDVLCKLFKLLEPEDQLRFANVTPQLAFVLRNYIWCANFKKLKIRKSGERVRVVNETNLMDFELSLEEFDYFLQIYGEDVEEFIEKHGSALNILTMLPNLVTIRYYYLLLSPEHIRLLAETCCKLETLFVHSCCNGKRKLICLGSDIEFEHLLEMKNLKSFTLTSNSHNEVKYHFKQYNPKKLNISPGISNSLECLNVYLQSLNEHLWPMFPNLQNLTLFMIQAIRANELQALAYACPQLKQLSFNRCSFIEVDNFGEFKNLTDLSLYHCQGLTYDNLKEILTELQLQTYTSVETKYTGLFHYYFVAPSIKSIFIDSVKQYKFMTAFEYYKTINAAAKNNRLKM